jgi:hypothetical protein
MVQSPSPATTFSLFTPGWRNGIRRGLKILGPQGRVGSTPTPGISFAAIFVSQLLDLIVTFLAISGVIAVLIRVAGALFVLLRRGAEGIIARELASTRRQRGDLTGLDDATAAHAEARRRRYLATGLLCIWAGLLIVPPLTPWPALIYATYSVLWLLPRRAFMTVRT